MTATYLCRRLCRSLRFPFSSRGHRELSASPEGGCVNNAEASFVRHARQWTSPLNRLLRLRKLSDGVVAQIMKAETCQMARAYG
jgi:hypothetical protein